MAAFASAIGRTCTHGLTPWRTLRSNMSRISAGDPMAEPVILTRPASNGPGWNENCPSSGLPTWTKGHTARADSRDDDVDTLGVLLGPVGIPVCRYVRVGAHLQHLVPLVRLPADAHDAVSTEGPRKEHAKMAQATDSNDTHRLARPCPAKPQGRVYGNAAAKHGRSVLRREAVGNLDDEGRGTSVVGCVAAHCLTSVEVEAAVRMHGARAVVDGAFIALTTRPRRGTAAEAAVCLRTDADAVPELNAARGFRADTDSDADDFMADTDWIRSRALFWWSAAFCRRRVDRRRRAQRWWKSLPSQSAACTMLPLTEASSWPIQPSNL
ncbi:hypothetical protein BN1708_003391 [Verticillium longisporum]|uniref:Uncharacterized protein n=1 Tax=Verticillium longisporum TaxID=100787 RepID=A0A0G4LH53_VERLO|nr:hypothetical protein BN1708_003391 [Verticillium longisporum]